MRRRLLLLAPALGGPLPLRGALAQAGIRPDPTPRLPPQPGQGLPIEERRFLRDAAALSAAQADAAARMAGTASDDDVRRMSAAIADRHRRLGEQIHALSAARGLRPDAPLPEAEAPSSPRVAGALRRLEGAGTGTERDFLAAQIAVHPVLVEMYQTEASHTVDRELGRFAIITLVGIQEDFAAVVRLGEARGLAQPRGLLSNPPQYGPGAGPSR